MADLLGSLFGKSTPGPWDKPWDSTQGHNGTSHTPEKSSPRKPLELFAAQLAKRDVEFEQVTARLNQYVAALAERDEQIRSLMDEVSRLQARGDRFRVNGQRLLAEVAELRGHAETIRNFAGGWKAMSKATHPDTGSPDDRAARTEIFKLVQLIFKDR